MVNDKLPITAYEAVLLPAMQEYGVPDQLNTDKGREWDLCAFATQLLSLRCGAAQRRLAAMSPARRRSAHRYVFSKRNVPSVPTAPCSPLVSLRSPLAPHLPWQTRVERFNREINMKCLIYVKALADELGRQALHDTHSLQPPSPAS